MLFLCFFFLCPAPPTSFFIRIPKSFYTDKIPAPRGIEAGTNNLGGPDDLMTIRYEYEKAL